MRQSAFEKLSKERREHMAKQCTHLDQIREVTPSANGCEDCLKTGDTWVHLRECLICGHVGCCDSSKNKHATKHFHATNHPIIQSFQPGENWRWCYIDQVMFELSFLLPDKKDNSWRYFSSNLRNAAMSYVCNLRAYTFISLLNTVRRMPPFS